MAGRNDGRRVVVTGLGAVTPLGLGVAEMWERLLKGESGIGHITQFDSTDFPVHIAGEVRDFDPEQYMERKQARRMARFTQFAVASARMTMEDARYDPHDDDSSRVGVIMGTGIGGGITETERAHTALLEGGRRRVSPLFVPILMPNAAAYQISFLFGLRGYNSTVVTACASATQAMAEAAKIIEAGGADVMVTGGAESSLSVLGMAGLAATRALSSHNDPPEKASRPFDRERDGFVASEGAGVLLLESLDHAERRGAKIYGEILGSGGSADAYHITAPDPEGTGAALAMQRALDDAGVGTDEVDYINAHATATPLGDAAETVAIKRVFGERAYRIPVNATKSMIGHLIGAAGAVEAIVTLLTLRDHILHPTINYENPDPECDLDCVPNQAREAGVDVALSNSFGFGGQNASIVLGRYTG